MRMTEQTALPAHKAVKSENRRGFIRLIKFHRLSDGYGFVIGRVISYDQPRIECDMQLVKSVNSKPTDTEGQLYIY